MLRTCQTYVTYEDEEGVQPVYKPEADVEDVSKP